MFSNLMLIPSYSCPASCTYCFAPQKNAPVMTEEILLKTLEGVKTVISEEKKRSINIIFHGGEPLTAGEAFFRKALPLISSYFHPLRVKISLQTNLWLLTEELCELFLNYGVSLGTSLDGPEEINDSQRGKRYFEKTMKGIELARSSGLNVGAICTFTSDSVRYADEIFNFFLSEGLDFTIHEAVPAIFSKNENHSLSPEKYGELLVTLLELYLENLQKVKISTLDLLIQSVSIKKGGICTFGNCLGNYIAVTPEGDIYPCQRFGGLSSFSMGNIKNISGFREILHTSVWKAFYSREEQVKEECGECPYFEFCRGGCPYNVLTAGGGYFKTLRDPYCPAYKKIFSLITERALEEVFSDENLEDIVERQDGETILRKGRIISIMKREAHPKETLMRVKAVLYSAALGMNKNFDYTADCLVKAGVNSSVKYAKGGLLALSQKIKPRKGLNNLYLHITFKCNLSCSHCYGGASPWRAEFMPHRRILSLCKEALKLGFRQAIITGGEPFLHPEWKETAKKLADIKEEVKPLLIVLRTNLALSLEAEEIKNLWKSFDKIAISIDGNRETHNKRRGPGSYEKTVKNLSILTEEGNQGNLLLTSILSVEDAEGEPGKSVLNLARELGIMRVHFKPLLPLGRACYSETEITPEAHWVYYGPDKALSGFTPLTTCGLGENLYVEPDGNSFPCYAYNEEKWLLGNVTEEGSLTELITSHRFKNLSARTVDTNQKCRECKLRYLCGGACRAWSGNLRNDFDDPPADCDTLYNRARSLLLGALDYTGISTERWIDAGLPL